MGGSARHYVWDLPTRLFHWLLVGLIAFSWWSAENFHMDWHRYSGSAVVGLLVFRVLWGLFGTSTARFVQFVKGPGAVWRHLRGAGDLETAPIGHNPLGSWSVVALLLLLFVQVGSGLFAVDIDGLESGPFSYLVDFDQGRAAASVHELSFNLLLGLIVLHVAAVVYYLAFRRQNLAGAMVTGYRKGVGEGAIVARPWKFAAALVPAVAVGGWLASLSPY